MAAINNIAGATVSFLLGKAMRKAGFLRMLMHRVRYVPLGGLLNFYTAVVRPSAEYGSDVFGCLKSQKIEKFETDMLKEIFGFCKNLRISKAFLYLQSNIVSVQTTRWQRAANY